MTATVPSVEHVPGYRLGAELAALVDGPWVNAWYWRADLEAQQTAARNSHESGATRQLGSKALYRPTDDEWVPNPSPQPPLRGVLGRAWRYQPNSKEVNQ